VPRFHHSGLRPIATVIAVWLALLGPASAQAMSEPAIKAAFLYNFAKFTEWPADVAPPGTPLSICILGDVTTLAMLQQVVGGRAIDGRGVRVVSMAADGPLRSCHVLYVAGDDARRDAEVFDRLKSSAVLTVGDTDRFARNGGISRLFVENGKMRFAINVDATQRARLQISSKVLALGVIVKDEGNGIH
jgi:hypothetical protein